MIDEYLKEHNKIAVVIVSLASTILGFYLLGNNLKAQWSIIDDHEIMYFLGSDLKLQLTKIPKLILHTEVGSPGKSLRYRPVYFALRIVEVFLWGANPALWYLSRIGMFIVAVAIFWWLSQKVVGFIGGFVFTLYLLTDRYWLDIWNRLGPQESYAAFGTALYFLGFFNLLIPATEQKYKLNYIINILFVILGSIIAIGSKENFLILIFPTIYLFIRKYRSKTLSPLFNAAVAIVVLFALFLSVGVILAVVQAGHDIYQREINLVSLRFSFLLLIFLIVWVIVGVYILIVRSKRLSNDNKQLLQQTEFISLILFSLYLSQLAFYRVILPTNTRYDFPGMLIKPLFLLLVISATQRLLKIKGRKEVAIGRFNNLVSVILLVIVSIKGFSIIQGSIINVANTQKFTRQIHNLVSTASKGPDMPLVFESYNLWDYEAVLSLWRFLIAYNVSNPMYLRLHGYSKNSGKTPLEWNLTSQLNNVSLNGGEGSDWGF